MTAIEALLNGLIDYAGLYPPAALDMRTAVSNYLSYRSGPHARCLGRFVVGLDRLHEFEAVAGDSLPEMRLSVVIPANAGLGTLLPNLGGQLNHSALEFKVNQPAEIDRIHAELNGVTEPYVELCLDYDIDEQLDRLCATGMRAKLRMGGVVAQAFPPGKTVAYTLKSLADRHLPFKATAGLHHPIRSRQSLTSEPDGPIATMHGFFNLAFAAVLLLHGGAASEALATLQEEDPGAWRIAKDDIRCRGFVWSADQIEATRDRFFISFGSCSFLEPMRDLEVLGWL